MKKVLDAWAILAWLQNEKPAANRMQAILDDAEAGAVDLAMNMINVGEVYYRLAKVRDEETAKTFLSDLRKMPIGIVATPNSLILAAAQWKARHPISYADAFAVATAVREEAPLVTGDRELEALRDQGVVEIEWLRADLGG